MKNKLFMLLFLLPLVAFAQQTISGTVVDDNQNPLLGASVIVKGTTNGAITDLEGNFALAIKKFPATLIVSYIGFETEELTVADSQTKITVQLTENAEELEKVVVIGYGQVKRGDVTGSVTTVEPEDDNVNVFTDVESVLKGQAAGVQVTGLGSEPGAPTSIRIRGLNSLTGNTQPLYVIDGIIVDSATEDTLDPLSGGNSYLAPQGGITGINPRDIESIEILKDASATAIYGSRGANGVVIITTKQGKKGDTKFNYSTTTQVSNITNNIDLLNTSQYIDYQNELRELDGFEPTYFVYPDGSFANFQNSEEFMLENADSIERLQGVDWSDDTYRTAITSNNRISASGGGVNNTFYFALGHLKNEGIIPRTFSKRTDFVTNLTHELSSRLTMKTKIAAEFNENSASKGTDNLGATNNNLVRQIVSGAPILGIDANNFGVDFSESVDGPRAWIQGYDDLAKEFRILGAVTLDYELNDVFTYRLRTGSDYRTKQRKIWYGNEIFRGALTNGEAGISTLNRFRYNIDNTLMFKKNFNKNHRINGTIGTTWDQVNIERTTNQASDFANQDLRADGISFGQNFQPLFYDKQNESIVSFLGRVNYTLFRKFLFTATMRVDGSSKFNRGNRFGYFPAAAFAWKIDKEKIFRKSETLSNAKLRLGWGQTGNQGIPNYRTFTPFGPTASPYSNEGGGPLVGIVPTNLANPNLTWETTSQYNAGLDLGFADQRFTATIDVFYKEIDDLLLNVEIGPSTGFENYFANQGSLTNEGIEFSMSADIIDTDKFNWNVFGNVSFIRNEITSLNIPLAPFGTQTYSAFLGRQISGGNFFKSAANIFIEGEAPGLFYGFATDGIISNEDDLANAADFRGQAPQLGDVNLVDQNGDGNITDADLTIIGDPNPDFVYGFGTSVSYKNVSLSLLFNGVEGNDIANGNLLREAYAGPSGNNIRTEAFVDAWSPENPDGSFPRVGYDLADETTFTDRIVEDGSFLRLNNVTLGYDLNTDTIPFLDGAYFSLSAQNLFLITDYSGFDPEVDSFAFDPGRVGVDWNSFPNARSFAFSVNLTF